MHESVNSGRLGWNVFGRWHDITDNLRFEGRFDVTVVGIKEKMVLGVFSES